MEKLHAAEFLKAKVFKSCPMPPSETWQLSVLYSCWRNAGMQMLLGNWKEESQHDSYSHTRHLLWQSKAPWAIIWIAGAKKLNICSQVWYGELGPGLSMQSWSGLFVKTPHKSMSTNMACHSMHLMTITCSLLKLLLKWLSNVIRPQRCIELQFWTNWNASQNCDPHPCHLEYIVL